MANGVVYKKNQYKIVVSFNIKDEINTNILQNEVLSLVIEVNEITHKR